MFVETLKFTCTTKAFSCFISTSFNSLTVCRFRFSDKLQTCYIIFWNGHCFKFPRDCAPLRFQIIHFRSFSNAWMLLLNDTGNYIYWFADSNIKSKTGHNPIADVRRVKQKRQLLIKFCSLMARKRIWRSLAANRVVG